MDHSQEQIDSLLSQAKIIRDHHSNGTCGKISDLFYEIIVELTGQVAYRDGKIDSLNSQCATQARIIEGQQKLIGKPK